ncbi:MAG TPA: serine hydrolase [Dongiaceae bacterium]
MKARQRPVKAALRNSRIVKPAGPATFYRHAPELRRAVNRLRHIAMRECGRAGIGKVALLLVVPGPDGIPLGAGSRSAVPLYPASVVKLFYLAAVQAWLARRGLDRTPELSRALDAMIRQSSNDATSYVVDLLTGTTSGPELPRSALRKWLRRRGAVQRYFEGWHWPEFRAIRVTQKTWEESPYGREQQSRVLVRNNRNRLTADAVARLLWAIDSGEVVSPKACREMRALMRRRLDLRDKRRHTDNQIDGFFGQGLPADAQLWSKAGWTSDSRHDAAVVRLASGRRFILVALTEGRKLAENVRLLPALAREAAKLVEQMPLG